MQEFDAIFGNKKGYPPVAFYFQVSFHGSPSIKDTSFKEVSGLSSELELESIEEGGENRFTHKLPKKVKHGNLILKRGLALAKSELVKWIGKSTEGDFSEPFTTRQILVSLLNEKGKALYSWSFNNAFPVKWELGGLDSEKNQVAIETIELSYDYMTREK